MSLEVRYRPEIVRQALASQVRTSRIMLFSLLLGGILVVTLGVLVAEGPSLWIAVVMGILEIPLGLWLTAPYALSGTALGPPWERTEVGDGLILSADEQGVILPVGHTTHRRTWDQVTLSHEATTTFGRPGPECFVVEVEGSRRIYHPAGLDQKVPVVLEQTRLLGRAG